jgi:hypothetical protein
MFSILDGRDKFYQWDKDRKVIVYDETITEVHFANCLCSNARRSEVYEEGSIRVANVPDVLLTEYMDIRVWGYDGEMTKHEDIFEVARRTKPDDYIYTPEEQKTWEELDTRITEAEQMALDAASECHDLADVAITKQDNGGVKLGGSMWNYADGDNTIVGGDEVYKKDGVVSAKDVRYVEAYGTNSMAIGMGAVAYARNSKSLGHRTQTGYPTEERQANQRPEAITMKDSSGNVVYPSDSEGQNAVAIGADNAALGNHSFVGGVDSVAKGASSFAFGSQNTAEKDYSVALGFKTNALGKCSLTSGHTVNANANYSTALGFNLNTSDSSNAVGQLVVGRYNATEGTDKAMLVVGGGNGDATRKNSLVVNRDGSAVISGQLTAGSINPETMATTVKVINKKMEHDDFEFLIEGVKGDYLGQLAIVTDNSSFVLCVYVGKASPYGNGWVDIQSFWA